MITKAVEEADQGSVPDGEALAKPPALGWTAGPTLTHLVLHSSNSRLPGQDPTPGLVVGLPVLSLAELGAVGHHLTASTSSQLEAPAVSTGARVGRVLVASLIPHHRNTIGAVPGYTVASPTFHYSGIFCQTEITNWGRLRTLLPDLASLNLILI